MKLTFISRLALAGGFMASGLSALADDLSTRVVGGVETQPYSRPYQVALLMNGRQGCGGTLISKDWVLTAAHCVDNASPFSLSVQVGAHSMSSGDGENIRVSQVIVHEYWRGASNIRAGYDIALLKLANAASNRYTPASLPTQAIESQYAGVGRSVTVSGWGLTSYGGRQSDVLREVGLPVISNASCSQQLQYNIPGSVICGGGNFGGSACNGDSGGPYAVSANGRYYVMGTVSWGINCRGASAFTRTTSYLNWIEGKTGIGSGDVPDQPPVAGFEYRVNGTQVSFNNTSSDDNNLVSYNWSFGDGRSSTLENPTHNYASKNRYQVTLTVRDNAGQSNSVTKSVDLGSGGGCSGLPQWSAATIYYGGDQVGHNGIRYEARWWTQGDDPMLNSDPWDVWVNKGTCN